MLMLSREKIEASPRIKYDPQTVPYQPGDVFLVKFMAGPMLVTVSNASESTVKLWYGEETIEQFERRLICRIGMRSHMFGVWLPFVVVDPVRRPRSLHKSVISSAEFWTVPE